jgi:chromosome segregation ATPase
MDLKWLKNKNASLAELKQQIEGARQAQATAIEAVASAQADFDADPSTQRKLVEAQSAEGAALLHVQRAERLLANAQAKADAEERAGLERRAAELREQLSTEGLQRKRAPTLDAELEALKEAVEARAKRMQVEQQIDQLEGELKRVRMQLGEPEPAVYSIASLGNRSSPSTRDVAEALVNAFRHLGSSDVRTRYASAMHAYFNAL